MRVGIYLLNSIDPSLGGNFSYHEKFIKAVDLYEFDKDISVFFVGRFSKSNLRLQKNYVRLAPAFVYSIFNVLNKLRITSAVSRLFGLNIDLCSRMDAFLLRKEGVDIVLFPNQFLKKVNSFPFITMNWDAGHKSTFAFPELLDDFDAREKWYRVEIQKAFAIFVESQTSKEEFASFYAIPESKIHIIPLFPGGVVDCSVESERQREILRKLNLEGVPYFYYPAQYWAHKNHYNLLIALRKFVSTTGRKDVKLVFSGSDRGNKDYVVSVVKDQQLASHVVMLGFVSNEEVFTLYKNAVALAMPTFLGPTNMPLLEAQDLETPVICSDLKGHRETCKEGALYCDPTSADQWGEAFRSMLDEGFRKAIVEKANRVRTNSIFTIDEALKSLEQALIRLKPLRRTFK